MKNQQLTADTEIYETHIMSELSVIFHVDRLKKRDNRAFNWHENIELLYFLEGEATVYYNAEAIRAVPGDIVVFPANCFHSVTAESTVYNCLIIDRGFCLSAGIDTSTLSFPAVLRDEKLATLYQRVKEEVEGNEGKYRVAAVRGAVLSLLAYLCRHYANEHNEDEARSAESVRKAILYIREHIAEPLTVDKLASVAGFSKFYFAREFKRVTSYTVVTYLNLMRIDKAKSLLSRGDAPVGQVASACGFNNLSYFSKIFRSQTGMSPSDYGVSGKKREEKNG